MTITIPQDNTVSTDLLVCFKTVFDPDTVLTMREEDLSEEVYNNLCITELWYEPVEDDYLSHI